MQRSNVPIIIFGGGKKKLTELGGYFISVNHHCPFIPHFVCHLDDPAIEGSQEFKDYLERYSDRCVNPDNAPFEMDLDIRDSGMFAFWFASKITNSIIFLDGFDFYEHQKDTWFGRELHENTIKVWNKNIEKVDNQVIFLTGPLCQ